MLKALAKRLLSRGLGSRLFRAIAKGRCGLRVLSFHRVIADDLPPSDYRTRMGDPTVAEFRALIRHLSANYRMIALSDYVASRHASGTRDLRVGLSFDDGYLDNLSNALPVLTEHGVPATVFASTDALDGRRLWFQRIYVLVNSLEAGGVVTPWDGKEYSTADRWRAMCAISNALKQYPINVVHARLDALQERCAGAARRPVTDTEEMIGWKDLPKLCGNGLVEVGSHTVSHPNLRLLNDDGLARELRDSLAAIRGRTGTEQVLLAYPNARYDARVAEAARRAGYAAGFTMDPGLNRPGTNLFALHREYLRHGVDGVDLQLAGM